MSDYRYTFTTREYFDWVKANGPKLYAQARIENEAALANAKASGFLKNIEKKALAQLDADEAWASKALDLQMETVSQQLSLEDN